MRTRKEIIEELSKAIVRRKQADEAIDALNEELKSFDGIPANPVFEVGDDYYRLEGALIPVFSSVGNLNLFHWNMFHTPEYAAEFSKRATLLAKLFHCKWYLDRDYKPDWKKKEFKYSIVYLEEEGKFAVNTLLYGDAGTVCFSTHEKADLAAAWMNEHALDEVEERKC